jgi:tetratricopeptide (TPR) repeat protein
VATSHADLGHYAEAFQLRQEVLARRQAQLGPDHLDTLRSMSLLAHSYAHLGQYEESVRLDEDVLARKRARFGPDHPETLTSMNSLGLGYSNFGNHLERNKFRAEARKLYEQGRQLHEETLARRQAVLGPEHPDTLGSRNNLANAYTDLGLYSEARPLYAETLAVQKRRLGANHPTTLKSMHNLANAYGFLGDNENGLKFHAETLALRKTRLGADHPDTLSSMWGVAKKLVQLDRGAEALPIIDEGLQRAEGRNVHPTLVTGLMTLRIEHLEKAKDLAECRATAEMWEKMRRTGPNDLYNAACFRAVTAKVLRATNPSSEAARQADVEDDRAMAWLRQAVAAGYRDVAKLNQDSDFDGLRGRADFRALLAELTGR